MKNESSRTFIGSVLCVDLVGYSKRSIAQQSAIKEAFNRLLAAELKSVSPDDRIILDTGDGAAITFLGDPEACFTFGLRLRDRMNAAAPNLGMPDAAPGSGPVRIGINMGPVKLAVDMNGHPNIIGDGINVAERITAFAPPGQIVVSRSFHDMVSRISDEHATLFRYDGMRTDGNVRHHEIYAVETKPATGTATVERRVEPPFEAEASVPKVEAAAPIAARPTAPAPAPSARVPDKAAATVPPKSVEPPRPSDEPVASGALVEFLRDRRKVAASAAILVAIIAVEAWMIDQRRPAEASVAQATVPSPAAPAPVVAEPRETPAPPPAPVATTKEVVEPPKASTREVRKEPPPKPPEPAPPKVVASVPAKAAEPVAAKPPPAKPAEKPAEPPAKVPVATEPKAVAKAPPAPAPEPKAPPPRIERAPESKPPAKAAERAPEPKAAPVVVPPAPPPAAVPPEIAAPRVEAPVVAAAPAAAPPPAPPPPQTTLLSRTPINFPPAALQRGIESGTVKARLTINGAGAVTQVAILSANPARLFDREVTRSLENWKFNAGADKRTYDVELTIKRPDLE